MVDRFTSKSGLVGNGGTGYGDAKATLPQGVALLGASDRLFVGAGVYDFNVDGAVTPPSVSFEIIADRFTVYDGANLVVTGFSNNTNLSNDTWTFSGGHARGFTSQVFGLFGTAGTFNLIAEDMKFEDAGGALTTFDSGINIGTVRRCRFLNMTTAALREGTGGGQAHWNIQNSVFEDCSPVVSGASVAANSTIILSDFGNIYSNCDEIITLAATSGTIASHFTGAAPAYGDNFYFPTPATHYYDDATNPTETTLAGFQTAVGGGKYLGATQETDPLLNDPANGFLMPRTSSPVYGAATLSDRIGPFTNGHTASFANTDPFFGTWAMAATPSTTGSGVGFAATAGTPILSGTVFQGTTGDVFVSRVGDQSVSGAIKKVIFEANETYPLGVVNFNNVGEPNRVIVRVRASNTAFFQNEAVLPWTAVEREADLLAPVGRFAQLEFTFRDDGIAA